MAALGMVLGAEPTPALTEAYWQALRDLPIEAVETAARRAMGECRFFPKPAELRELAGGQTPALRAAEAFSHARKAISAHGRNRSVDFDDPIIPAVIRALRGTWLGWCNSHSEDLDTFLQRDFVRLYVEYAKSPPEKDMTRVLLGEYGGTPAKVLTRPVVTALTRKAG